MTAFCHRLILQHSQEAQEQMLELRNAFSSFAVNDIEAARRFYGEKLGLKITDALPGGAGPLWLGIGGEGGVLVYPKADHVAASFTVLNLSVRDIERAVDELGARGIRMERYPEYKTDDRGIFRGQGHSIAWFKDPAGNGLSVVQEAGANGERSGSHSSASFFGEAAIMAVGPQSDRRPRSSVALEL